MLRKFTHILTIITLCGLTCSCTTWTKPGADANDLNRDEAECRTSSYQIFPPQMSLSPPPIKTTQETKCKQIYGSHDFTCSSESVQTTQSQYSTQQDININPRSHAFHNCMLGKGWNLSSTNNSNSDSSQSGGLSNSERDRVVPCMESWENKTNDWKAKGYTSFSFFHDCQEGKVSP